MVFAEVHEIRESKLSPRRLDPAQPASQEPESVSTQTSVQSSVGSMSSVEEANVRVGPQYQAEIPQLEDSDGCLLSYCLFHDPCSASASETVAC